ncbi:MAG: hypothetical protein QOC59_43, partial [Microbacteriaceae bacterium]|nr:hypothetical protein [Microbacteriaceae bacterium]
GFEDTGEDRLRATEVTTSSPVHGHSFGKDVRVRATVKIAVGSASSMTA